MFADKTQTNNCLLGKCAIRRLDSGFEALMSADYLIIEDRAPWPDQDLRQREPGAWR
jgi:hypothetical protein